MQEEEVYLNISIHELLMNIDDVDDFVNTATDGEWVLKNEYDEIKFLLSYPFEEKVEITIFNTKTVAGILFHIAKCYEDIYKKPQEYGVWGHSIEDLYFEGLRLRTEGYSSVLIAS